MVMDQGRIAERGSHQELLRQGGIYSGLWHVQQQQRNEPEAPDVDEKS